MSAWDDGLEGDADQVLVGISDSSGSREATMADDRSRDAVAMKLAAMLVRRQCNQHGCEKPATGACGHPEHRRDVDYMRHCLDVLGLPSELPDLTPRERQEWLGGLRRG